MTASKKLFNDVKTTIHGVIVGLPVFNITGTLPEKESRERNLKIFYTKLHTHFCDKAVFLHISKKFLEKHQNIV